MMNSDLFPFSGAAWVFAPASGAILESFAAVLGAVDSGEEAPALANDHIYAPAIFCRLHLYLLSLLPLRI